MYVLAPPGSVVKVRPSGGTAAKYHVSAESDAAFKVTAIAENVEGRDIETSYPALVVDQQVVVCTESGYERPAVVRRFELGNVVLGPTSRKVAPDRADCPYCWRPEVAGTPTGIGSGAGYSPEPITVSSRIGYRCPDCKSEWTNRDAAELWRRWV